MIALCHPIGIVALLRHCGNWLLAMSKMRQCEAAASKCDVRAYMGPLCDGEHGAGQEQVFGFPYDDEAADDAPHRKGFFLSRRAALHLSP